MHSSEPGGPSPDPSDSVLLTLARAAMAPGTVGGGGVSWPRLDLDDPGQRTFGDYELVEEISRGGMGVVYRARQRSLEREVAVKFVAAGIDDEASVARFLAEARAAARLVHPNIVPVHEVGSVDGLYYFSMPLIRGRTLADLLDPGTLAPDAAVALMLSLCDAIDYAHRLGLLHLDLKPANVMLDERNQPQVADFGLARHIDERGGVDAQEVSGTPSFMAPEQILIRQYRLTAATDIYALGAILYRCLAGVSPHGDGQADDVLRRVASGRIRALREVAPTVPRDLDAICMKCLELQPADRYPTVAALADDLRRVRDGQPVSVRRAGTLERLRRWAVREPRVALATAAAALALVAGTTTTTWQWRHAVTQRDRAAVAGEIGAHLFAFEGEEQDRAEDLLSWLRKRFPGDEIRQADALVDFAGAVAGNARQTTLEPLLAKVLEVMGEGYRRDVIAALLAGNEPRRYTYAALLASVEGRDPGDDARFQALAQAAVEARPDDLLAWRLIAVGCPAAGPSRSCAEAARQMSRGDPDNAYPWLMVAMREPDAAAARAAIVKAASLPRYEDYVGASLHAFDDAIRAAGVPAPPLVERPARLLAPREPAEAGIALLSGYNLRLEGWQSLMSLCGVGAGAPAPADPMLREECLRAATLMMRSRGSVVSRMIGVALVKALAPDTALAREATGIRRLYVYLGTMDEQLGASQRLSYPPRMFLADLERDGELVAFQRRISHFGIPPEPPADWQPGSNTSLLSSTERLEQVLQLNRDAATLLAAGKHAQVLALLEPADGRIRGSGHDWILVRYLITAGIARAGLGRYAAARDALQEACTIAEGFGPDSGYRRECARDLGKVYADWDAAEPGNGHAINADRWLQLLAWLETRPPE